MIFALDASIAMSQFLQDGKAAGRAYANWVLDDLKRADTQARVPLVWGLEVGNVIVKAEARGYLAEAQSEAFIELLMSLDIVVDSSGANRIPQETLDLARRYGLSTYDASYLEFALREGLPLAALDEGLWRAAHRAGVARA